MHDMRNIDNFRRALHNGLDYRDPFFLNFDKKSLKTVKTMKLPSKSKDDQQKNIDDYNHFLDFNIKHTSFVLPAFLKAGRCTYIIEFPKGKFYFHKALIHFRTEPIVLKLIEDQFDEENDANESTTVKNKIF